MLRIKALSLAFFFVISASAATAGPTAYIAIDVENGEVLIERFSNTRLHPAGLTKLMTLYVAFQAIEGREVSLDTAIAEGLSGSEELFAQRMNIASNDLGLANSSWKNPHGLTEKAISAPPQT